MDMPPGSMSGGGGGGKGSMAMMHMSLYWGKDAVILFPLWPEKSLGMYVVALFFIFFLALVTELLSLLSASRPGAGKFTAAFSQAGVYSLRMALGYLVMLAVMSFNIGIFMVAIAGHALGFFIVRCRSPATTPDKDVTSGCH